MADGSNLHKDQAMSKPILGNILGCVLGFFFEMHFMRKIPKTSYTIKVYRAKLWFNSNTVGITFGSFVFISEKIWDNDQEREQTILHESVHVQQWHDKGWFGFGFGILYILYSIKYGYYQNPFEVEARKISGN